MGSGWNLDYFNKEIQDRIKIINSVENVFDFYGSAKCLLYTSLYGEGYPNIIAEGMIMGVPIVGYDTGDFNLMIQTIKQCYCCIVVGWWISITPYIITTNRYGYTINNTDRN